MTLGLSLVVVLACAAADESKTVSPAEQLAALARRGFEIHDNFDSDLRQARHDRTLVSAANQKYHDDAAAWAKSVTPLIEAWRRNGGGRGESGRTGGGNCSVV